MKKLFIAALMSLFLVCPVSAEILQLHIANQDTDEAQRKQAGDIVSVHNADHQVGNMTKKLYLDRKSVV